MFKKLREYEFREIINQFVLMRNTDIVKNPIEYEYIDKEVEEIKKDIVNNTVDYYQNKNENLDAEELFNMDNLNEVMPVRSVYDLYEPIYAYIGVDSKRGYVLYLLGNKEDKQRYVYSYVYYRLSDHRLDNVEIEILDEYQYELEVKSQLQFDEERDKHTIQTRDIRKLDLYRTDNSPDYVNCVVQFKNAVYSAKVKLKKIENEIIYALYHNIEGTVSVINRDGMNYLLFKPIRKIDEEKVLKEYLVEIADCFRSDYQATNDQIEQIVQVYEDMIRNCYVKGDLPFETIEKIMDDMNNNKQ